MNDRSYLIIDDSLTARMKLKQILDGPGVCIQLADSAADGTRRALVARPDVAILDVVLPDEDGISVCQHWQEHPDLRSVPILLVSGERSGRDDRLAGLRSGAVGYLLKPFDEHEIIATVENLYSLQRVAKQQALLNQELRCRNDELSAFAHVISHDLKAPLRAIGSLVDCILEDCRDQIGEPGLESLHLLKSRTRRLHELIGGILRFSACGEVTGLKRQVDTGTVVRGVVEALSPARGIELKVSGPLPSVHYDRIQFEQVLQNLVSNAIGFMDKPAGVVSIWSEETPTGFVFHVEDNGPGIPESQLERVFEVFATMAPRDEHDSVGVGLAIVRKIVEQNGGRVWAESRTGGGSCFSFTVPHDVRAGDGEPTP